MLNCRGASHRLSRVKEICTSKNQFLMEEIRILGLMIRDRIKEAGRTQGVLSQYGHLIQSRLGFHQVTSSVCSRTGVIILQLRGAREEWNQLEDALNAIGGLEVRKMSFD